ncbi:MAG: hypothetical protein ACHREM_08915 [Polyangiales bacterium]
MTARAGRIHRRLVALLNAEGFGDVRILAAQGHYRSDSRADAYRWEGTALRDGVTVELTSWETMTKCVHAGIVATRDHVHATWYDVSTRVDGTLPVTDPNIDAPDGAVVDGRRRVGDQWVPLASAGRARSK